jgi:hypothetical protein
MAIPLAHYVWLTGGFFLGMFFMYNLVPFQANQHPHTHLQPRQKPANSVLKFGNPGILDHRKAIYIP